MSILRLHLLALTLIGLSGCTAYNNLLAEPCVLTAGEVSADLHLFATNVSEGTLYTRTSGPFSGSIRITNSENDKTTRRSVPDIEGHLNLENSQGVILYEKAVSFEQDKTIDAWWQTKHMTFYIKPPINLANSEQFSLSFVGQINGESVTGSCESRIYRSRGLVPFYVHIV